MATDGEETGLRAARTATTAPGRASGRAPRLSMVAAEASVLVEAGIREVKDGGSTVGAIKDGQ